MDEGIIGWSYEEDRHQRAWEEAEAETLMEPADDDDDDRLRRLGINNIPRPEPVEGNVVFDPTITAGQTIVMDTTANRWRNVRIQDVAEFSVMGTMTYNGEDIENVIRRIVREELQQLTRREEE